MTLEAENVQLKRQLVLLQQQVKVLEAQLATQQTLNAGLTAQIKQLQAQLAKDSHNSSKPPSSDGYKRPPKQRSLKQVSGKKSGAQKEHPGHALTQIQNPDYLVEHFPQECQHCQTDLSQLEASLEQRRQVFELPPLKLEVTEHRIYQRTCPTCQTSTCATFPTEVTNWVQYGPRFRALAVYLNQYQLLPYARTAELIHQLVGHNLSQGTLANLLEECYDHLVQPEQTIKQALTESEVAHFDETGGRIEGKLHWFHVASNESLTYYAAHPKRGQVATKAIGILADFGGTAVHDNLSAYRVYECQHALCNAHHLRELIFLDEHLDQSWAGQFKTLLIELKEAVEQAKAAGATSLPSAILVQSELRYQKLLLVGLLANPPPLEGRVGVKVGRKKQSKAKNLLDRLQDHRSEVLAFAYDFKVPFDNNQAERDLRMIKVQQKVSGGFRSQVGAKWFCRIRGYISTLRKQGRNIFSALYLTFKGQPPSPVLA